MDSSRKYNNPSPEVQASFISKLFFCWMLPFFKYGYSHDLDTKDIYNAAKPDLSEPLGNILEKNWNKELAKAKTHKTKPSLSMAICRTFYKQYMVYGAVLFIQCIILRMVHPLILAEFINYFDKSSTYSTLDGWLFGIGVVLVAFANCLIMHQTLLGTQRIGMRCRVACCSLLYRKLLKLSKISLGKTATGQVVNLMSNDVQRFDVAPSFLHFIWIMPIQTCIATLIMFNSVGYAAITGVLAMAIQAVFLQGYLSKLQGKLRYEIAKRTDARIKLMTEITSGIQVIKMYAWEKPFEKVVQLSRKLEINALSKTSYIRGFMVALMVFTERFTLYLTVITYVLLGNRLTSDKVFSLAQFFNTIQLYMSIFFPLAIALLAEARVSVKRLEEFLLLEENVPPAITNAADLTDKPADGSILIEKVRASWIPNPIIDTLTDINLDIRPGILYAVVGSVGSGKSSLLQLILKELPLSGGKLAIEGEISFAAQEPWLFVSSVKNNILFGQTHIRKRYGDVVSACALEKDFEQFPQGDKTLVGERGVSLSGGQRARINLARCVYREADIYLLDDPLSAVDAHVGKHLFEECIVKYLKNKTRILVTHQVQFLKEVDQIIIMNNGQIQKIGTFDELSDKELSHLKSEPSSEELDRTTVEKETPVRKRLLSINSHVSTTADEDEADEPEETQELMEKGALSTSLYSKYFKAGASVWFLSFLMFLIVIAQAFSNAGDLWVTYWTNKEESRYNLTVSFPPSINGLNNDDNSTFSDAFNNEDLPFNNTGEDPLLDLLLSVELENNTESQSPSPFMNITTSYNEVTLLPQSVYIYVYTVFIIGSIILTTVRSLIFYKVCMNASKNLHNTMFNNILQATMRFFDTNPSGRILNRFSKDIGIVDEFLPRCMLDAIQVFMVMSGILIMVFIVQPWMILPTVALAIFFFLWRYVYTTSAQNIKRLEGITRAPVFSHVSSSLSGLTTIRSCRAQYMVSKEFDVLQDQHTGSWYLFLASIETFGFYLDIICVIFLGIVTFQFLIFNDSTTPSGNVGLVISQSLILTGMLQHGMRQTAEVASQMTSVERVLQYSKIEKEGPFESTPTQKPPRDWPQNGVVKFENMELTYVPSEPPVLHNLNIDIKAGERVGIVGRTGAGKSSLISALFRLAPIEGHIFLDDVDIKMIGLHDLRSKVSIIPQEPILFSTSVRKNLDPFDKCDDKTLWQALENVELKDAVESLEQEVSEGGSNFSAGQRQLVCLARAIIRNNKILVLDEATANVDPQTDNLIQMTIRRKFKDCTVLTIAHRLNTIMDSDKILVMDGGEAVEFGIAHELLQRPDGYLTKMVQQTGKNMEVKLKKIAEDAYNTLNTNESVTDNAAETSRK